MNKTVFLSLSVAVAFAACSETDNSSGQQPAPERLIRVEVSENPLADEATGGTTRSAAMTTTATLDKFAMNYQTSTYNFTKTGETWSIPDWPNVENSDKIDFYAYTDGTFNYNSGSPYLSFTVDENVSSQHDLLVAVHKEIAYSDNDGSVSLTFNHACAVVQFNVQMTNTLKTTKLSGNSLTVNSIVLRHVDKQGNYNYATETWTNAGAYTDFTLTNTALAVTTTTQRLPCGYLFMIPQSRTANGTEGTYLEVNYTTSGAKTATIPLNVNWQAGHLYTINIKLGTTTITP